MKDEHKTKAQLIAELAQMRRRLSELEKMTPQPEQMRAELAAERERRELAETLYQIGAAISSSLNYERVLDSILDQLGILVPHDAACILLKENDNVQVARWQGYPKLNAQSTPASITLCIEDTPALQQMQQTGHPLLAALVEANDPRMYGPGQSWVKSFVSAPIYVKGQLAGFIKVDSATPEFFNASHARRLAGFAEQAAVALRNAQLYDQARREINKRVVGLKKERNFVSAVLNTVGALIMVLNPHGRILRFNRVCEQTTGYSLDEVKGKPFWDLFLTTDEAARMKSIFKALQKGEPPQDYESNWLTKDGRRRVIAWSNNVLPGNGDPIEYIISTGIDITERRQLEDRLVAIHHLGRELNLLRDEVDICNIALETASFLLPIKSLGYGVLDDAGDKLTYYYYPIRGVPKAIELNLPLDDAARLTVLMAHSGQTTAVLDVDENGLPLLPGQPDESWLTAPMKVSDRLVGVLDVKCHELNYFSPEDRQLFQTLADQTAVAIENARLHRETQQRIDELTTLSIISQAITSTLNLEETLTIITDHAIRLLDAAAASVVLHDEVRSDLWFNAASGGVSDFVRKVRLPAGHGIVGWVIEHGEPALVPDVSKDPRFFNRIDEQTGFQTRSVICVPLQTDKQTTGAIEVMNKNNGSFTPEDLRMLSWLAAPATIAIENARLFEAETEAREQAETLREATTTLTSTLDLDQVLDSILVYLEQVVPFDNAFVFLQKRDKLQMVARRGSAQIQPPASRPYSAASALYQEIYKTGQPVILADAQSDPRFDGWKIQQQARGWMGVPLIANKKVIGCLTLDSQQISAYDQTEAAMAQAFANQATVAIQNAQLFEQVRASHKQLQSLSRRLVQAQETERRHIARELHDEAGQSLTSLMVGLGLLEREAHNSENVVNRVSELKQMTNDILENLHRLAINLRPATLDHLGLTAALRQYIDTFSQQHGLKTQFEIVGLDDRRLPPAVETNLYRIVQEALTNVVRHAGATRVDVLLERRGDQMVTIVEDDGVGFDPDAAGQSGRLGLLGMRERAEMLGGVLSIESVPGSNTTIYVEVPYDDSNTDS